MRDLRFRELNARRINSRIEKSTRDNVTRVLIADLHRREDTSSSVSSETSGRSKRMNNAMRDFPRNGHGLRLAFDSYEQFSTDQGLTRP